MALKVSSLRRWLAISATAIVLLVAATYWYARYRARGIVQQIPEKMGLQIQQSAQDFTISKSDQGRTIFKLRAKKAVQLRASGHAELRDVEITLYGRDSSRFDQIRGADFDYDPQSGDVFAKSDVEIDLESNPEGIARPDQAAPVGLRNPIHLKTRALRFNQKTGNATTDDKVEFRTPRASGSAVGVLYTSQAGELSMQSQVRVVLDGPKATQINAERGVFTKDSGRLVLEHPYLQNATQHGQASVATLYLTDDNSIERVVATGGVRLDSQGAQAVEVEAARLDMHMGEGNALRTAVLSDNVRLQASGRQAVDGWAGRATLTFANGNLLKKVHAEQSVRMIWHQKPATGATASQEMELRAPILDTFLTGSRLERAETGARPQLEIRGSDAGSLLRQTSITAGKFLAGFDNAGQLASMHGASNARVVTREFKGATAQPERISTSKTFDASFRQGGIESVTQAGDFYYFDEAHKAWANRAHYTPSDQMLSLEGSPRVADADTLTTAQVVRMNRATGEAYAEGDVKSTYSNLKPQPGGALLASSDPIHVTSASMVAHSKAGTATYSGKARLWQGANMVEAPSIEFNRDQRSVLALGSNEKSVRSFLVQTDKEGKTTPVTVTGPKLIYTDNSRDAHFEGGVVAKGADATVDADEMHVLLNKRESTADKKVVEEPAKVEQIIASGHVIVIQPGRNALGDKLVYTAATDKFVLTGGPPSIFDAEQGKITGVSLTLFRHDARVLVEGSSKFPSVTKTQVAR